MTTGKSTVRWSEWTETWRHVSAGGFGCYESREKGFDSADQARGFADGLRTNPRVRDVEVATEVGW